MRPWSPNFGLKMEKIKVLKSSGGGERKRKNPSRKKERRKG